MADLKEKAGVPAETKKLPPEVIRKMFPTFANLDLTTEDVNALGQGEQQNLLNKLDYRRKYQLLRKSGDMVRLLRQMPAEDLFFTIEAAGRTDAIDLVLAASPDQLTRIFDLTCWDADRFDPDELLDWFGYMIQIDLERAMKKLRTMDVKLIILMLSKYIRVIRMEWSDDRKELQNKQLITMDGDIYQFEVLDVESTNLERLDVFLKALYRQDLELYNTIMETLIWELPSNLEEANFRSHSDRMADHGYPDYLDAITVFAKINPKVVKIRVAKEPQGKKEVRETGSSLPAFYGNFLNNESYLTSLLSKIDQEALAGLRDELVHLVNRTLVARKALTDLEQLKETLKETHRTLSLGIEYLSDGSLDRAQEIIGRTTLSEVFRIGHSLTLELGKRASAFHEREIEQHSLRGMSLISSPSREVLTALMRRPPLYYAGATPGSTEMITRHFENMAELERAEVLLGRIEFLFDLIFHRLAVSHEEAIKGRFDVGLDPLDPDIRLIKIFMTVFANAQLGQEPTYRPIPQQDLGKLLSGWLIQSGETYRAVEGFEDILRSWLDGYAKGATEEYRFLAGEWARQTAAIFKHLASEIGGTDHQGTISMSQILLME